MLYNSININKLFIFSLGPNKYKLGSELKGPNWSVGIPLATAEPSYRGKSTLLNNTLSVHYG